DHRDLVSPGDPARHLPVQVRARTPALRVGPVAIGQDKDVQPHDARPYRGCLRRTPTMTPVKRHLPTAAAALVALALGASASVALAQSAGDEQYADPFAKQTTSSTKPHATTSQSSSTAPTASAAPPVDLTTSTSTSASGTSSSSGTSGTPSSLPRTGLNEGLLVAVGAAL